MAGISHRALTTERQIAVAFVLGVTSGSVIYGSLTLFGLVALIATSGKLSDTVLWLGACYLLWLGVTAWRTGQNTVGPEATAGSTSAREFGAGLMLELTNPKGIAFFVSVFAVAIPTEASWATKSLVLSLGISIELLWYLILALALSKRRGRKLSLQGQAWLNRLFGTAYIFFALVLMLGQKSG